MGEAVAANLPLPVGVPDKYEDGKLFFNKEWVGLVNIKSHFMQYYCCGYLLLVGQLLEG